MITIDHLHKTFSKRVILKDITLKIPPKQITGIIGPNACGKTTLIKSILGFVIPESGKILTNHTTVTDHFSYRKEMGYMAQTTRLPENLKTKEILDLLEGLRGHSAPKRAHLSEYFEITKFLEKPFGVLSDGVKQRVGAVVAFMFDPKMIVLDEPTASLDPETSIKMRKLISKEWVEGKTVILISHIMSEIEELAHNMILMLDGSILYQGDITALKQSVNALNLEHAVVEFYKQKRKNK